MKFWITKYALTSGIMEVEAEDPANAQFPEMVTVPPQGDVGFTQHFHGKDWHRSREDAVKRAGIMRDKKVHNLHRRITKLEQTRF